MTPFWYLFGFVLGSVCNRFGIVLESFGIVLGSFWDRFGIVSGSFWDRFGIVLESFWDLFGFVLGSFWNRLGPFWDRFGIVLGSFWGRDDFRKTTKNLCFWHVLQLGVIKISGPYHIRVDSVGAYSDNFGLSGTHSYVPVPNKPKCSIKGRKVHPPNLDFSGFSNSLRCPPGASGSRSG